MGWENLLDIMGHFSWEYRTFWLKYRILFGEYRTLLREYRTLSRKYRTLFREYRTLSPKYRTLSDLLPTYPESPLRTGPDTQKTPCRGRVFSLTITSFSFFHILAVAARCVYGLLRGYELFRLEFVLFLQYQT